MRLRFIIFSTVLLTFLIDRISKIFVCNITMPEKNFIFDLGIISITRVYNTGAAFGILQGMTSFLLIFSLLVIIFLIIYMLKNHEKLNTLQTLAIAMILGGTAGNFFDRLFYGYVVDFIKLNFIDFPVFNMADLFINIGVILIFTALFSAKQTK